MTREGRSRHKPPLFIGCTEEHNPLAEALCLELERHGIGAKVWNRVRGQYSRSILDGLMKAREDYTFGVFLLTPDDCVAPNRSEAKEGKCEPAPGGNVIFELGMWLGHSGQQRTRYLVPFNDSTDSKLKLPSDLDGITHIGYEYPKGYVAANADAKAIRRFRDLFHDQALTIASDIQEYIELQEKQMFIEFIDRLKELINNKNDEDAIKYLESMFGQMLRLRANAAGQSVRMALSESLEWFRSLLDDLGVEELAVEQRKNVSEVWVFAPHPLEGIRELSAARKLRAAVRENLLEHKINYLYFVESEEAVDRIGRMVQEILEEGGTSDGLVDEGMGRVRVAVSPGTDFLTFFTIHLKHDGKARVLQSVIKDNRDDMLIALDPARAEIVRQRISEKCKGSRISTISRHAT
jgi:hypothetical protein